MESCLGVWMKSICEDGLRPILFEAIFLPDFCVIDLIEAIVIQGD